MVATSSHKATLAVGALGHHAHGKTTLLEALTHVASPDGQLGAYTVAGLDRLPKAGTLPAGHPRAYYPRGTICFGIGYYEAPSTRIVHVDVPGRRRMIRQVARAAPLFDVALLVVSAEEGVEAQTREHLYLARQGGVSAVVVFINKCDLVTDFEQLDVAELEVRELLEEFGYEADDVPVVRGAASEWRAPAWRSSIEALLDVFDGGELPAMSSYGREPVFLVDRVFNRRVGPHRLVAGRLLRGTLSVGSVVDRVGIGLRSSVDVVSMEHNRVPVMAAGEGANLGLAIGGPGAEGIRVGHALVPPTVGWVGRQFTARLDFLVESQGGRHTPVFSGYQPAVFIGTACIPGRVTFEGPGIQPGEERLVTLTLAHEVYAEVGLTFALRDGCDGLGRSRNELLWAGTSARGTIVGPVT